MERFLSEDTKFILEMQHTILYALRNMNNENPIVSRTCQDAMDRIDQYFDERGHPHP